MVTWSPSPRAAKALEGLKTRTGKNVATLLNELVIAAGQKPEVVRIHAKRTEPPKNPSRREASNLRPVHPETLKNLHGWLKPFKLSR